MKEERHEGTEASAAADKLRHQEGGRSESRRWIATLGGAGFLPGAPGTWGSLAAAIVLWPILSIIGPNSSEWLAIALTGTILFSVLCVAVGRYAVTDFGTHDPGPFVLDEAAGICLTLLLQQPQTGGRLIITLLLVFGAFRLFDVTKPPPCKRLEKFPAGWGILLDDLMAAVYANLLCQIVLRFLF